MMLFGTVSDKRLIVKVEAYCFLESPTALGLSPWPQKTLVEMTRSERRMFNSLTHRPLLYVSRGPLTFDFAYISLSDCPSAYPILGKPSIDL